MPGDTVFDRILRKELPVRIVHEDEDVLAFHDAHPQAPVHVLVIPKKKVARKKVARKAKKVVRKAKRAAKKR